MAYKLQPHPDWLDLEQYVQWTKGMAIFAEKFDKDRNCYFVITCSDFHQVSLPIVQVLRFFPIMGGKCQVSVDLEAPVTGNLSDLIKELLDTLVR